MGPRTQFTDPPEKRKRSPTSNLLTFACRPQITPSKRRRSPLRSFPFVARSQVMAKCPICGPCGHQSNIMLPPHRSCPSDQFLTHVGSKVHLQTHRPRELGNARFSRPFRQKTRLFYSIAINSSHPHFTFSGVSAIIGKVWLTEISRERTNLVETTNFS